MNLDMNFGYTKNNFLLKLKIYDYDCVLSGMKTDKSLRIVKEYV